ncbi:MAG: hypothetical protein ACI8YQ_004523 [Polaribacter sp.]|jgi:hypothetical protein
MKNILIIFTIALLAACQQNAELPNRVSELELELRAAKSEIAEFSKAKTGRTESLAHLVYLDLKEDISGVEKKGLLEAIQELSKIPGVKHLKLGAFKNLNDPRALSSFELFFQMDFKDTADYKIYQRHEIHLALKKLAKGLLAGPPVTYDYEIKK